MDQQFYIYSFWYLPGCNLGIFKYEHDVLLEFPGPEILYTASRTADLKKAIGGYGIHALIVIGTAVFLPYFGEQIAGATGMSNSLFGTLFWLLQLLCRSLLYHWRL